MIEAVDRASTGLRGRLHVELVCEHQTTSARVTSAQSPLELRGPFLGPSAPRFYLRNVSCGVFGGDAYDVSVLAGPGALAIIAASSATKVHAMPRSQASSSIRLQSAPGAAVALADGPLILQAGADFAQRVEIVTSGGIAIHAEVVVFGRLARGEIHQFRRFRSELIVRDEAFNAAYVERLDVQPHLHGDTLAWATAPVIGRVIIAGADDDSLLAGFDREGDGWSAGFDSLPSRAGLVVRVAGQRLEDIARVVDDAIDAVVGSAPRIGTP